MVVSVRIADRARPGLFASVLLFFIPTLMIRVSLGEADFPLRVFYLAAVGCVVEYNVTGQPATLPLQGSRVQQWFGSSKRGSRSGFV
jgi:hypothetical protein